MNRVDGKVALVTGGARGIGGEAAKQLVQAGAKVAITDVLEAEGTALADELGNSTIFLRHDVTNEGTWKHVIGQTVGQFGGLDILVNNAGVTWGDDFDAHPESAWSRCLQLNVTSIFNITRAFRPMLRAASKGNLDPSHGESPS